MKREEIVIQILKNHEDGLTTEQLTKIAESYGLYIDALYRAINDLDDYDTIYRKNGKWYLTK